MSRFSELLLKEDKSADERKELEKLAFQLEATAMDVGNSIATGGTVSRLRAGSVVLDTAGMHTFLKGVETGRIEADGDFLLGSNIAAAATTSFVVFSNAQTYNSESVGAGDLLIGDNSASKANILWDKSTGKLLFRGGTTTQGYIDTTGKAVFGGGHVEIDSGGIAIQTGQATTNLITWEDIANSDATAYGKIYTYHIGTTPNKYGVMIVNAGEESGGSGIPLLWLQATDGSLTGNLQLLGSEGIAYTAQSAADNNVVNMVDLERTLSGNSADGFGFQLRFILDDDSSTKQTAGLIQTKWSDVSEGMARMDIFCPDANTSFLALDMLTSATWELAINDSSRDMNFRVESDGDDNMLFVDGGANKVTIGGGTTARTAVALQIYGNITATELNGWNESGETWTYASATTFTVSGDRTPKFYTGLKLRLTQTTAKFFYVVSSNFDDPGTTITITGGGDYTLANAAITAPYYSQGHPRFFPDWFNWTPVFDGFASDPVGVHKFRVVGNACEVVVRHSTNGTSNATNFTMTLPITAATITNAAWSGPGAGVNNGGNLAAAATMVVLSAGTTIICQKDWANAAWTNVNAKSIRFGQLTYEI